MLSSSSATNLGIHQWYSMHVLDYCEGNWAPSAASPNSYKNILYCAPRTSMYDFNLTAILTQELAAGGSDVTLSDLNWPTSIQSGIDGLRTEMDVVFVFYCISIALSIFVMFGGIVGLMTWGDHRVVCANLWLSFVSTASPPTSLCGWRKLGGRLTCSLAYLRVPGYRFKSCHGLRFQSN